MSRGFASDNNAPGHPAVLEAIAAANDGHVIGYGDDPYTERARAALRDAFGDHAESFFVLTGTGANVLALRSMCREWEAAICAETAHVNVDECGAAERIAGVKLLAVDTPDGKLTPELAASRHARVGDEHASQPRLVTITNATELGTIYAVEEVRAIADWAHERDLLVHVDGARLANAAAALHVPLRALTTDAGVDAVSFGLTKCGGLMAEALVLLRPGLSDHMPYLRKQTAQLVSKMRFLAVQFEALLDGERWRGLAEHANAMARRLHDAVVDVPGVEITQRVESNAVFATIPPGVAEELRRETYFYDWGEDRGEVRWMCSWDTTEEDVDRFTAALRSAVPA